MIKISKKQRRALRAAWKLPEPRNRKEHGFRITRAVEIAARTRPSKR